MRAWWGSRLSGCLLVGSLLGAEGDVRQASLDQLLRILPPTNIKLTGRINATDKSWEAWQKRTGELPPDWSAMPQNAFLPEPLLDLDGRPVRTRADWERRRQAIRQQYQHWISGTMPPAPDNLRAVVTGERTEGVLTVRDVRLEFGPEHKATLRVQVLLPPGQGPFPVFLTNHPRQRPWVATAVRRGYIGVIYSAADPVYGDADDSDPWLEIYPQYDWSCVARWAWAGMRAVDYVVTLPQVDRTKIAISGHSRNGKQAVLAAAFDERIGAVALSSGNTGEGAPWRYTTPAFGNESLEQITTSFPHWFHPRLRFFAGREQYLPVDQNSLLAMIAPRGLLMASSAVEGQGAPFGSEQAYRFVRKVYEFLGAGQQVGLSQRYGEHATTAEDIEQYVDFFDHAFGRGGVRPETWVLGFDWETWRRQTGTQVEVPTWPARGLVQGKVDLPDVQRRVRWTLGEEATAVPFPASTQLRPTVMTNDGPLAFVYGRPRKIEGAAYAPVAFGDDLKADFYYPAGQDSAARFPVAIWLHGFSHATGYSRDAPPSIAALVQRGFAVLAFDQIGFGTRIDSVRRFYERYPRWSLMGKMVADTRAAVDAVAALPNVDAGRIYLVGQSLGSKVALTTAVLEPQVAGLVLMGGTAPVRLDVPANGTEGVRQWSHLHGLLPKLGFFVGQEGRLPVDDDELLAAIAPRRVLIVAPELDRYSPVADVREMVRAANQGHVTLQTPEDSHRFTAGTRNAAFDWLAHKSVAPRHKGTGEER